MLANKVNKQDHTEGRNTCCSPNCLNNESFHLTQSVDGSYDYILQLGMLDLYSRKAQNSRAMELIDWSIKTLVVAAYGR